jgi:hypothetical protein
MEEMSVKEMKKGEKVRQNKTLGKGGYSAGLGWGAKGNLGEAKNLRPCHQGVMVRVLS